jgi:glycosyltransferase involved in cell wall biosynthesis
MRIAIDARLNAYRRGGIPQYTRHLLTALADVARDDQFISLQHRDMVRPLVVAPNVMRRTLLTPPHHRFEAWTLPLELVLSRPDVMHFPDFIAPRRRGFPAVVTIHDLAFMHYPDILDDAARAYYGQVKDSANAANAIIAVSEATRQDIVQFLDIPPEQIQVIYEAAAPMFRKMELRPGEARVLNGIPVAAGAFMLFMSTLEPRKNLPTLLQALRICLDRRPGHPYMLVVAGGRGWRDEAIFTAVRDLRLADHVLFAGSVGQYDLRWLYNACQFYVNPSLYEGFGLPLLEAMACGTACLAAATSSLPEIGGDAAIYVPPLDPGLWADAIEDLWDNQERQRELSRLGRARAQRFSWQRAARETLRVYQHVVDSRDRDAAPTWTTPAPAIDTLPTAEQEYAAPQPFDADGPRPCLRCSTPLVAGEIQQGSTIHLASPYDHLPPLAPRTWLCPNCGYVEMVAEPANAPYIQSVRSDTPTLHDMTVPAHNGVAEPAPRVETQPIDEQRDDQEVALTSDGLVATPTPDPEQHEAERRDAPVLVDDGAMVESDPAPVASDATMNAREECFDDSRIALDSAAIPEAATDTAVPPDGDGGRDRLDADSFEPAEPVHVEPTPFDAEEASNDETKPLPIRPELELDQPAAAHNDGVHANVSHTGGNAAAHERDVTPSTARPNTKSRRQRSGQPAAKRARQSKVMSNNAGAYHSEHGSKDSAAKPCQNKSSRKRS